MSASADNQEKSKIMAKYAVIPDCAEARQESLSLLRKTCTEHGFVASLTDQVNYRRVWARDSVITGLGALLAEDAALIKTLRSSLETLVRCQSPEGHIPSNVKVSDAGEIEAVSFGGLSGRVYAIPWFVIGVCNYAHAANDWSFAEKLKLRMESALNLLPIWKYNRRGLVYVPQGGDWADEYVLMSMFFCRRFCDSGLLSAIGLFFVIPRLTSRQNGCVNYCRLITGPKRRSWKIDWFIIRRPLWILQLAALRQNFFSQHYRRQVMIDTLISSAIRRRLNR